MAAVMWFAVRAGATLLYLGSTPIFAVAVGFISFAWFAACALVRALRWRILTLPCRSIHHPSPGSACACRAAFISCRPGYGLLFFSSFSSAVPTASSLPVTSLYMLPDVCHLLGRFAGSTHPCLPPRTSHSFYLLDAVRYRLQVRLTMPPLRAQATAPASTPTRHCA